MTRGQILRAVTALSALTAAAQSTAIIGADVPRNTYAEAAASFDCRSASRRVEIMICRDDILALLDGMLGDTYQRLQQRIDNHQSTRLRQSQRTWLERRNACRDRGCVVETYEQRLDVLQRDLANRERQMRVGVSRVGQCQVTSIDEIGSRLRTVGNDPPTGTHVAFDNGVHQVSYSREMLVWDSRVGDRARVCLVSIPAHCPPGDDRGRIYDVTNLRTGTRWKLPDASHRCGGA